MPDLRRYLDFDVRRPSEGVPLLWPVKVWKIIYHAEKGQCINAFQKAILGLVRVGHIGSAEISSLLGLYQDLVSFIIATQLIPNGWMTAGGRLTEKGREVLDDIPEKSIQPSIAYVYQDALSGGWFPRVSGSLPEIEATRLNEKGFPVFMKDRDSGREVSPFVLSPRSGHGVTLPNWEGLSEALEKYRLDLKLSQRMGVTDSELISLSYQKPMDESGQSMWLWVWLFPDRHGEESFLIADPFGLRPAVSWLRRALQERLSGDKGLGSYVARVIDRSGSSEEGSYSETRSNLRREIDLCMMTDYAWLKELPEIDTYFRSVMRRRLLLARQKESSPEDWRSLLMETSNLAESVLRWLLNKYPANIEKLPNGKHHRIWSKADAESYLKTIRLDCMTDKVIERLSFQPLGAVRQAVKTGNSAVKALIFANYLAVSDHERHPFRIKSREELKLDVLMDMAELRNKKAGHAGDGSVDQTLVMSYSEFLIQWVQLFKG